MPAAVRTTRSLLLDDVVSQDELMARNVRLGMTERQRDLNRAWAFYLSQQYEACLIDWDGKERPDSLHSEAISATGLLGHLTDVTSQPNPLPLKFRRPSAPYAIVPTIVDRFTGVLFSEKRHPVLRVPGEPVVESLLVSLAEAIRLWPTMMLARTFGGAIGTVVVGAKLVDGRPRIEIHDPRWCEPVFADAETMTVASMEKRYFYPRSTKDPKTGRTMVRHFWYRRILDGTRDIVFKPAEVTEREPVWVVESEIEHGFGFCPVVWAQNLPLPDSLDGLPDCPPFVYDISHQIDMLLSQSVRGTLFSCDPTPVFKTDAEPGEGIQKGAGNALFIGSQDDVKYLEMAGSGAKAAIETARELRALSLESAQCVLENPDIGDRATATEVERAYSLMLVKAGKLREQYSKFVVKPLVVMLLRALRSAQERGAPVLLRSKLDMDLDAVVKRALEVLDPEGMLELEWPRYFEISLTDVAQAVTATAQAYTAGLLDLEGAARFLAKYLDVKDVPGMLARLKTEKNEREARAEKDVLDRTNAAPGDGEEADAG